MSKPDHSSARLQGKRPWRERKPWLIAGAVLLAGAAVAVVLFAVKWPFTREAMINRLEKASSAQVELGSFHSTYFPPGCVAEAVTFRRTAAGERQKPETLMTIAKLTIQTSYHGLFSSPKRITQIAVDGLRIHIPAKNDNGSPQNANRSKSESLLVEEVHIQNATIEIPSRRVNGNPLVIPLHEAVFRNLAGGRTIPFRFSLHLPLPPGEISADGWIGPWSDANGKIRSTPVSGSCVLQHGNLSAFESLAGSLSAHVSFSGTLEKLNVSGDTDSPDFAVKENGHRTPLSTRFQGTVDLRTGDVSLPTLNARLGHTDLLAEAKVAGWPKTVDFNVKQGKGEIQDLILLFSKSPRSPVRGAILFHTRITLPHEPRPFEKRVRLAGEFNIDAAQFTSSNTQQHVDQLSARARGEKNKDGESADQVLTDLKGRVLLENGIAKFSAISFSVPGATANMHGTYSLTDKRVNLSGKMRMEATVSQATSGIKSFFLKLLDPIFKKKKAGAVVPVTMTGSYGHTHFSAGLR